MREKYSSHCCCHSGKYLPNKTVFTIIKYEAIKTEHKMNHILVNQKLAGQPKLCSYVTRAAILVVTFKFTSQKWMVNFHLLTPPMDLKMVEIILPNLIHNSPPSADTILLSPLSIWWCKWKCNILICNPKSNTDAMVEMTMAAAAEKPFIILSVYFTTTDVYRPPTLASTARKQSEKSLRFLTSTLYNET